MPSTPPPRREKTFNVLTLVALQAVIDVRKYWSANQSYPTILLAWPTAPEVDFEVVNFVVPEDMSTAHAIEETVSKTQAYAIFLLERRERCVKLLLETRTDALSITLPIEQHGDLKVLGTAQTEKDSECIGVLFRRGATLN